jgi:DNA-binding response OmpR family regulator
LTSKTPDQIAVLVVEDDAAIRKLVSMVMTREGYKVEVAPDGVEAVLKLGLTDYDLVILDLMMPNLDGFALIEKLNEHTPERLKSIIVTSAASPAVIRERLKGIPLDVLPKPFDIKELAARVKRRLADRP